MDALIRTDLAAERMAESGRKLPESNYREHTVGEYRVCRLKIENDEQAERLHKPIGCYLTVECGDVLRKSAEEKRLLVHLLAGELRGSAKRLTGREPDGRFGVFVAGLGNAELTADAVGPKTVSKLTATRHLQSREEALYEKIGCSALSALSPGVLGQTGIETAELLRGVVGHTNPDLMVVIDALAARSCERLASTVQISDSGIDPGSGVGNHRVGINRESMGVPVLAIGVPTVVDSSTLVYDALCEAGIREVSDSLQNVLHRGKSFFVSPKESDMIAETFSDLFSQAIELAFVGALFGE